MAVYFMPRDRNNIWWGGGRGGGGILDLVGQALIQPMLQRDALARQFNYKQRLEADDRAYRLAQLDRLARGIDARGDMPVGAGDTIAGLVGSGGNLRDFQGYYVPQLTTTDYGDRKEIRSVNQWDTDPIVGDVGLSPKEAEDVAIARRGADLAERQFADESARNWYIARQTARGGGKAPDLFAGIKSAADLYEALSKFDQGGNGGMPGIPTLGGEGATSPVDVAGALDLAQRFLTGEIERVQGRVPQNTPSFEDVLRANGGLSGGSTLGYYNTGALPDVDMDDTATITPQQQPTPTTQIGGGLIDNQLIGLNPRGYGDERLDAQRRAAMVRQHAQNRGISYEEALRELSQ